jgi:inosine/xanthosine triphosphate pyrophosphatase family protein
LDEIGADGICNILNNYEDRTAVAGAAIAYYDGDTLKIFENEYQGSISLKPEGDSGFGWNRVFIPKGEELTLGSMSEKDFEYHYGKIKPFSKISKYLKSLI